MKQHDVILIGAGIAGTSAAAMLAEHHSLIVLEQEAHPGQHSTGRSAATWDPFYGPPVIQALTELSAPLLNAPCAEFSKHPFTSQRGQMVFTTIDSDARPAENTDQMIQLTKAEAREKVSLLKTDRIDSIWYADSLVNIDVDMLHQAFIRQAKRRGAEVACNSRVKKIVRSKGRWVVTTENDVFTAQIVVNASGAWADQIAAMAGLAPIGLQPKRRTAALVPYKAGSSMHTWPMLSNAIEDFYCMPFGPELMISPVDETQVEPHDAWPSDFDVAVGIERFQNAVEYDVPRINHSWAGLRTFSPDGAPVVGFDANASGFFWLAGQGGYGIQTSAAMAILVQGLINESFDQHPQQYIDIAKQLSPNRFED